MVSQSPAAPENSDTDNSLEDSGEVEVLEAKAALRAAEAKLRKAEASLAKAKAPLLDQFIIRGLIPIALALVGPWALWKFDTESAAKRARVEEQVQVVSELGVLLDTAVEEREVRAANSVKWRARMQRIEESRAAELVAMSTMVLRLDETLRIAMVQMTLMRVLRRREAEGDSVGRAEVVREVAAQSQILNRPTAELEKMAGIVFDEYREHAASRK